MCFSATASFGASGLLLATGIVTLSQVKDPKQIAFASTPLLFSVQQLSEGMLWQVLPEAGLTGCQHISTYVFVTFGQSLWPLWVPFSLLMLEKSPIRKIILSLLFGTGMFVSAYLFYLSQQHKVTAELINHHIFYRFNYHDSLVEKYSWVYLIPAVLPNFVSSLKSVQLIGVLTFCSFILSQILFSSYVFSTWCFFSALISALIFFTIRFLNKIPQQKNAEVSMKA
jgi:hypothetical protein